MDRGLIFDTHAHLNGYEFSEDRDEVISSLFLHQVGAFTEIGFDLESSEMAVRRAEAVEAERGRTEHAAANGARATETDAAETEAAEESKARAALRVLPEVYAAVGFHPDHAAELTEQQVEKLRALAASPRVVAVGEIGLDYYYVDRRTEEEKQSAVRAKELVERLREEAALSLREDPQEKRSEDPQEGLLQEEPKGTEWDRWEKEQQEKALSLRMQDLARERCSIGKKEWKALLRSAETVDFTYDPAPEIQKACFICQMALARELKLPIVIHSRDAARDTFELVKEHHGYENSGIVHCFSYSSEVAREFVKLGMYVGVGGVLTFPNARKLVEVAEEIPLSRIVLETDSPYMAPVPLRGSRNTPGNLGYVVEKLAEIRGISREEVIRITTENALKVYRIRE